MFTVRCVTPYCVHGTPCLSLHEVTVCICLHGRLKLRKGLWHLKVERNSYGVRRTSALLVAFVVTRRCSVCSHAVIVNSLLVWGVFPRGASRGWCSDVTRLTCCFTRAGFPGMLSARYDVDMSPSSSISSASLLAVHDLADVFLARQRSLLGLSQILVAVPCKVTSVFFFVREGFAL